VLAIAYSAVQWELPDLPCRPLAKRHLAVYFGPKFVHTKKGRERFLSEGSRDKRDLFTAYWLGQWMVMLLLILIRK